MLEWEQGKDTTECVECRNSIEKGSQSIEIIEYLKDAQVILLSKCKMAESAQE
ncbi:MAG: hypothetical protein GF411_12415 [Candidatus Lokiarchaeota archaeon]|nr:hypothetical protein [Candidatus Lokiarchaeota archaeon]